MEAHKASAMPERSGLFRRANSAGAYASGKAFPSP
jgi:hypothetical protein